MGKRKGRAKKIKKNMEQKIREDERRRKIKTVKTPEQKCWLCP